MCLHDIKSFCMIAEYIETYMRAHRHQAEVLKRLRNQLPNVLNIRLNIVFGHETHSKSTAGDFNYMDGNLSPRHVKRTQPKPPHP